jgi:Rrf2 family transcriptional regulator, cysteine metabolism repressor
VVVMLFSTKAEYGVRLMIELGRRAQGDPDQGGEPVALSAVAEAEVLPLSYLEHLVAKLRAAGLVTSVRGAHGGYRLARPASRIEMLEVVQALEGPIAPMECLEDDTREGRVLCSHESDGDRACATKLLWTRVHGGITKALAGTTLAELVEFAEDHGGRAPVAGPVA